MSLNEKFVTTLFDAMMQAKPSLAKHLPDAGNDLLDDEVDHRELSSIITKEFPWPVGIELRRLLSGNMDELSRGRLDQLLKTYERTLQFLAFLMVINLYETTTKKPVDLPEGFRDEFNSRFRTLTLGNYLWLISSISNIFKKNELHYFIDEMNELFTKSFLKKAGFLLQDRNEMSHFLVNLSQEDIEIRCVEYMDKLCELLVELTFLIKYPLVTIPEIQVKKHRKSTGMFAHQMLLLNSTSSSFFKTTKDFASYTESPSVFIIKSAKDLPAQCLNLSPLIIDTHSEHIDSAEKKLKLRKDVYLFSRWDEAAGKVFYVGTEATDKPDISLVSFYDVLLSEIQDIFTTICTSQTTKA